MPLPFLFSGVNRRIRWVRVILLSACFAGMVTSAPLWHNARNFPLLRITAGFPVLPAPWDQVLLVAMLMSLVAAGWFYRPAVACFLVASLFAFCEDQDRGQPWFYMYWVMLGLTLLPEKPALEACRWAMSAAYIWSGIQKCQPGFFKIVPAWFVVPAARWHFPIWAIEVLRWLIATAPAVELFIGLALWMSRLRTWALGAALVVHATALLFLGPLGYNYDRVIWPWNLAMPALLLVLFGAVKPQETPSPVKPAKPTKGKPQVTPSAAGLGLRGSWAQLASHRPTLAIVALYCLLPLLSYAGWWDSYFSFTLYAENQAKADIFVTQALADRLPPPMQTHVHKVRLAYDPQIQGPFVFDFQTWGFKELRVPPILEPRNYRNIFTYLRPYSREAGDLRMIVAPRAGPARFYEGDRCEELRNY